MANASEPADAPWPEPAVFVSDLGQAETTDQLDRIHALVEWLVDRDALTQQKYRNTITDAKLMSKGDWHSMFNEAKRSARNRPPQPTSRTPAEDKHDPEVLVADRRLGAWARECPDVPDGLIIPHGWKIDRHGVEKEVQRREDLTVVRIAYGPVLPVATHVDPAGMQLLELVWHDGIRWVNRLVPRAVAKAGKKLVAAVGGAGFPVTDSAGKDIETFLAAFESLNRRTIPEHVVARHLGWQPDGTFVTSSGVPRRVEPAFEEQRGAIAAHTPSGTLEGWQAGLAVIEPYPVVKICIYCAFAAPLLKPLGLHSFTVDISGNSTRGKSTAGKLSLSVWANPGDGAGGIHDWGTKLLAAEYRLNICHGISMLLDETKAIRDPDIPKDLLYLISRDKGSPRGGGWASELPWSTVVLSTGEQSVLSFLNDQGAGARTLTIKQPPFGAPSKENAAAAVAAEKAAKEHHAVAGAAFVARLQAYLEQNGVGAIKAMHKELTEKFRGENPMSARRAPLVAVIALAAKMAHEWGIVPFTHPDDATWRRVLVTDEMTDNRPAMALDVVREYIASQGSGLWVPDRISTTQWIGQSNRDQPPSGWIGRHMTVQVEGDDLPTIAVLPQRLKEALKRAGHDLAAVLPGWEEMGALVAYGKGRGRYLPIRQVGESKARVYVFAPWVFDGPDDGSSDD